MSLSTIPNEVFIEISKELSFKDQQTCMYVCRSWHFRFQPFVFQSVYIKTRKKFKAFFMQLQKTFKTKQSLGLVIRRLKLDPTVGLVDLEFMLLPIYCPFLEYVDFNPLLWRYFKYTDNVKQWHYLTQLPTLTRARLALPILCNIGQHMTQLKFDAVMIDELFNTHFTIISILRFTPNLKSLQLTDGIMSSQNMSIFEFESIHTVCPKLETLYLDGFDGYLKQSIDIETLPISNALTSLRLNMSINNQEFLCYWGHKYPNLENLDIQLKLLEPEYRHQEESSRIKESFAMMATQFTKLKQIKARFDEKYFPCDVFLRGLNNTKARQMQDISIHFYNFDYHRRSARNFKFLLNNSLCTITTINISNWDRSWDYETDILEPMSQCHFLQKLSLTPQPGTLTEFDIDVILDYCTKLKQLELANTYNLFIRDDTNDHIHRIHPLKHLSLQHTMVNNRLFDYLSIRCPDMNRLDISHFTKPYDNEIQVKINMPHHRFESIRIEKLRLGLRIEDDGFQCNHYSTLFSIEEIGKMEDKMYRYNSSDKLKNSISSIIYLEKWYHLYQPKQPYSKPRLQKIDDLDAQQIKCLPITRQLWEQIAYVGSRLKHEHKENWCLDIPYGYFSIRCKSVNEFVFEGVAL